MKKNKSDVSTIDRDSFKRNEIDANKSLAQGCVATALVLLVIWIMYQCNLFVVYSHTLLLVNITFPITITLFATSIIYTHTKLIEKKGFKYFLLYLYIFCIAVLNVVLPKHTMIAWALCIILANHYYSPKVTRICFISVLILCVVCMYCGMLIGEWDSNLMNANGNVWIGDQYLKVDELTASQRITFLHDKIYIYGDNRYYKCFVFYYLPRAAILSICFYVSAALSKRTLKLMTNENTAAIKNEKYSNELNIASDVQNQVLPKQFPSDDSITIYASMNPAKEVGGDFYDFFYINKESIGFVIADVSGKGVPAALFMMKATTLIRSLTMALKNSPAEILNRVNKTLCQGNEFDIFVTCWFGILNIRTGHLIYVNAGHNAPLFRHNGRYRYLKDHNDLVLAAMSDTKYHDKEMTLSPDDAIFLYTDGVTETHNKKNDLYGEGRLLYYVNTHIKDNPETMATGVTDELLKYSNGKEQFDDCTMLLLEFHDYVIHKETYVIQAENTELNHLKSINEEFFTSAGLTEKTINKINLAIEEIFVNIANYGYKPEKGVVELEYLEFSDRVVIRFKDTGRKFNPLSKEDPDLSLNPTERSIGGLGIFMVKQIMDEVSYEFKDNNNIFTIIKNKDDAFSVDAII